MSVVSEQSIWHNIDTDENFKVGIVYVENKVTYIGGTYLDNGVYEEYSVNEFYSHFQFISEGKV